MSLGSGIQQLNVEVTDGPEASGSLFWLSLFHAVRNRPTFCSHWPVCAASFVSRRLSGCAVCLGQQVGECLIGKLLHSVSRESSSTACSVSSSKPISLRLGGHAYRHNRSPGPLGRPGGGLGKYLEKLALAENQHGCRLAQPPSRRRIFGATS